MTEKTPNEIMNERVPTDIRRACLIVSDIEKSLKIYHELFGMKFWYDEELVVVGEMLPAGEPNSKARLVILQGNDPLLGMLGILQYIDPPLPEQGEYPKKLGIGGVVFVVNHSDVQYVHDELIGIEGVHIQSKPHVSEYPRDDGGVFRRLGMSFFDPNGYFFEVNQVLD